MGKRDKERRNIKPATWTEKVIVAANTNPEDMDMTPSKPSDSDIQATSTAAAVSHKESSQKRDAVDDNNENDQEIQDSEERDRKRQKTRKGNRHTLDAPHERPGQGVDIDFGNFTPPDFPLLIEGEGSTNTQLSKAERKLKKKEFKKLAKLNEGDNGQPSFMLSRSHTKLSLKDLRDLVVYLLTETKTLPWIMVKNKFNIHKVVLLYVEGLDPDLFHVDLSDPTSSQPVAWPSLATSGPVTEFKQLQKFFDYMNVIKAGGDKNRVHSATNTLLNVPLSNTEKARLEKEKEAKAVESKKSSAEQFILTLQQLEESDYPLPTYLSGEDSLGEGWIQTEQPKQSDTGAAQPEKKLLAIDCEMCRTSAGSEVTRVTVIDDAGKTIYDELVLPHNPILDYLTQYSGITAERLEGVTTRLEDVQKALKAMVTYDTILIGHSLENDMKVLKFAHPFIIDTCIVFHHTRGPPFKASLKWLSHRWLGRKIQQGGEKGHDSAEDAKACMDLVQLKVKKGAGFGEYNNEQESIFSRLGRNSTKPKTSVVIDRDHWDTTEGLSLHLKPDSDAAVVEAIPKALESHHFVWARLRDAEINHGKMPHSSTNRIAASSTTSSACSSPGPGSPAPPANAMEIEPCLNIRKGPISDLVQASEDEIREGLSRLDRSIAQIVESLPPHTALLVTSGHGDLRPVVQLQGRQKHFQRLYNTLHLSEIPEEAHFLEKDQEALSAAVDKAKNGVCFFMVK